MGRVLAIGRIRGVPFFPDAFLTAFPAGLQPATPPFSLHTQGVALG